MNFRKRMSKSKKMVVASSILLLVLVTVAILFFRAKDRIQWHYFEFESNMENILFSEVSRENPNDIVYITNEHVFWSDNYFSGHYMIQPHFSGRLPVKAFYRFFPEYDQLLFSIYDLETHELVRVFDVLEILSGFEGIMESYGIRGIDSRGVRIADAVYLEVTLVRRLEDESILLGEGYQRLLMNIVTGEYRLEKWDDTTNVQVDNTQEFDIQMSFFDGSSWMGDRRQNFRFRQENGFHAVVDTLHLQPDTIRIVLSSRNLPETNERLYTFFPSLEHFRNQDDDVEVNIILTGYHWTAEAVLSLFIEENHEVSFENITMRGTASIDRREYEINSLDDYFRVRGVSRLNEGGVIATHLTFEQILDVFLYWTYLLGSMHELEQQELLRWFGTGMTTCSSHELRGEELYRQWGSSRVSRCYYLQEFTNLSHPMTVLEDVYNLNTIRYALMWEETGLKGLGILDQSQIDLITNPVSADGETSRFGRADEQTQRDIEALLTGGFSLVGVYNSERTLDMERFLDAIYEIDDIIRDSNSIDYMNIKARWDELLNTSDQR